MKKLPVIFWSILAGLTLVWGASNTGLFAADSFIAVRNYLVQYFGFVALASMSVIMVLATRPKWLEPHVDGLDKSYRLHKWFGITALSAAILHWLASNGPKWASQLGLISGGRHGRGDHSGWSAFHQFLGSLRGTAEGMGEWVFYLAAALMIIALVKWVPYRWFAKTHTILAAAYLALVAHAIVLFDFDQWFHPVGIVLMALMASGSVSACLVLAGRVGKKRKVGGTIRQLDYFPKTNVLETVIELDQGWAGHRAGQFAFVTFDRAEGAHPFTIASAWDRQTPTISVISKALGDYTRTLPDRLNEGGRVSVEGPYGCFTFDDDAPRQIWVGGGIGITPFVARLKQLAQSREKAVVDLYHTTAIEDEILLGKLRKAAEDAGVTLRILIDQRDGLLSGDRLRREVKDWKSASVWFCGPAQFGRKLREDMVANGLAPKAFHQEFFAFR
jgi:predicted ferric reductase